MSIKVENLSYTYNPNTPFETKAVKNISFTIAQGEMVGLIGHTGSGKSTLIQMLNGLLTPSEGKVIVKGLNINSKDVKKSDIRKKVGLVFQYPEYQLFEETVYKDIAFGPKNLNLSSEEIDKRVKESMALVHIDFDSFKDKSPFELSGGQKRRVAIAGVLAMNPDILILDEPTAGLDPKSRDQVLSQLQALNQERNTTIILVSHGMEQVANLVNRLIVLEAGTKIFDESVREVFKNSTILEKAGLDVPQVTKVINQLREKGFDIEKTVLTVEEAKEEILNYLRRATYD